MQSLITTFTNLILAAGLGFRGWLFFNTDHENYDSFNKIWRFCAYPLVMFALAVQLLPDSGLMAWSMCALGGMGAVWIVKAWLTPTHVVGAAADVAKDEAWLKTLDTPFDPEKYINLQKGVFVGLNSRKKPIYLPQRTFDKNHFDILGTTGVGKSSFAGVVISQLAALGETIVVFDPKNDRNLPGALARVGREWGSYPVHVIDLRPVADFAQVNPFRGCREDQIDELVQVALDLGKTGDAGVDFYRGKDREAAGFIAQAMADGRTSMLEIVEKAGADERVTEQENLWRELRQVGRVKAFHTTDGLDLVDVLSKPGVLYIIGSTLKLEVVAAQKLLLQRILQIVDERKDANRPVGLFLDELKYILSPAALRAAGTVRDRNCHLFFAHQSLGDLEDCAGLNPKAVKGAIWGNSTIKIVYKLPDSATAKELDEIAGESAVQTSSISDNGDKNSVSTRIEKGRYMPAHIFNHLPRPENGEASVGVVFGIGTAWYLSTRWLESGPTPEPIPAPLEVRGQSVAPVAKARSTEADGLAALFD